MRLINADALKEDYLWCKSESTPWDYTWDTAMERVDMQPTIQPESAKWISVKDKLPEKSGRYLICAIGDGEQRITTSYCGNYFYMTGRIAHWRVTHWMPLPEPPEE